MHYYKNVVTGTVYLPEAYKTLGWFKKLFIRKKTFTNYSSYVSGLPFHELVNTSDKERQSNYEYLVAKLAPSSAVEKIENAKQVPNSEPFADFFAQREKERNRIVNLPKSLNQYPLTPSEAFQAPDNSQYEADRKRKAEEKRKEDDRRERQRREDEEDQSRRNSSYDTSSSSSGWDWGSSSSSDSGFSPSDSSYDGGGGDFGGGGSGDNY